MKLIILGNVDKTCGSLLVFSQLFCCCFNVLFLLSVPIFIFHTVCMSSLGFIKLWPVFATRTEIHCHTC